MMKAVNAPLQGRTIVLEKDFLRSTEFPTDYETDLEFEWTNISKSSFFCWWIDHFCCVSEEDRNLFYQKQLAKQLMSKMNEMIDLLTDGLNVHLNLGQNFQIDHPSIFTLFQTVSPLSLQTEKSYSIGDARIRLSPMTTIDSNTSMSFRVRFVSTFCFCQRIRCSFSQQYNL